MSAVYINEELPSRELLESLTGPEGRRRLVLRHKTNEELFQLYDGDLPLYKMTDCMMGKISILLRRTR